MKTDYLLISKLNIVQFELLFAMYKNDIDKIHSKLKSTRLDDSSLGYWIWDVENNTEIYSQKFRETLGYKNEQDFPNLPSSWMSAIDPNDKIKAIEAFKIHANTFGQNQYELKVTYNTKQGDKVRLICLGKIVSYTNEENPKLMIGVHLPI